MAINVIDLASLFESILNLCELLCELQGALHVDERISQVDVRIVAIQKVEV